MDDEFGPEDEYRVDVWLEGPAWWESLAFVLAGLLVLYLRRHPRVLAFPRPIRGAVFVVGIGLIAIGLLGFLALIV